MRTRLALLSAAASGALALGCVLTAAPASAAPVSTECLDAQNTFNVAESALQQANSKVAADRINGVPTSELNTDIQKASQASAAANVARTAMNIQCGTTGGTGTGNGFPRPRPVPGPVGFPRPRPVPGPVGIPIYQSCAVAFAAGVHDIPFGDPRYRPQLDRDHDGVACELNGNDTTTVIIPPPATGTYRVVNGKNCRWDGTTWVPVTVIAPPPAADPCNCTPTPAPQPAQVIVQPAPQVTQTVVEQPPVVVPPAQVFTNPVAPSVGAVATGDGTMAGQH